MRPRRFPEANCVYRLPGGNEDNDLFCQRVKPGHVVSEWELDREDLQELIQGGRIRLHIYGEPIPPVGMEVFLRR